MHGCTSLHDKLVATCLDCLRRQRLIQISSRTVHWNTLLCCHIALLIFQWPWIGQNDKWFYFSFRPVTIYPLMLGGDRHTCKYYAQFCVSDKKWRKQSFKNHQLSTPVVNTIVSRCQKIFVFQWVNTTCCSIMQVDIHPFMIKSKTLSWSMIYLVAECLLKLLLRD